MQHASIPLIRAPSGTKDPFIQKLRMVNSRVLAMSEVWSDVDDVLDNALLRRFTDSSQPVMQQVLDRSKQQFVSLIVPTKVREFHHLPRGSIEPWIEYAQRVQHTPFFPETPGIVGNRVGSLFAKEPTIEVHPEVQSFLPHIGKRRQSFASVLRFLVQRSYSHGFLATLVDFRPLPKEVKLRLAAGRAISVEEARTRNLAQPVLGVFNERQVLDFEFAEDGRLKWVKLRDTHVRRALWSDAGTTVEVYRVVDRDTIDTFVIEFVRGEWKLIEKDAVVHGATNEDGDTEVPVVFTSPFLTGDEVVGDSAIYLSVTADLVATRILSSILWALHFHGTPQLVLATPDRDNKRMRSLAMGATRYLQTFLDRTGNGADEELSYLQMDTSGLEMLVDQYDKFVKKANELANRTPPSNMSQPIEQSGIAKAWDFKTGQEQAISQHKGELEKDGTAILQMVSRRLADTGVIPIGREEASEAVRVSFDPSAILGNPELNLDLAERIIDIGKKQKIDPMVLAGIRRVLDSIINLSEKEDREIRESIALLKVEEEEPPVPALPVISPEGEPPEGGEEEDEE